MKIFFLIFLSIILGPVSSRRLLFISLGSAFFNSSLYELTIEFYIEFTINFISVIGIGGPNILVASNRNPPACIILYSWLFENLILADEPFVNVFEIFETCVTVNN